MDRSQKDCLGSGVAPQIPIPQNTMDQKRCFGMPQIGVFEMDNAKNYYLEFWGGDPNTHTPADHGSEKVFFNTWDGCI